jgi:nicotinate-nucleotide pyrophosphorylase (carboxylating)
MTGSALNPTVADKISRTIEEALFEDIGLGDITTEAIVSDDVHGKANVLVKARGIVAGLEIAGMVFRTVDPTITLKPLVSDGSNVEPGTIAASVDGPIASILKAERTALNFLQRMSGIATLTQTFVQAVSHTHAKITDTRKTAPALRTIDKLAVSLGGGVNHRFGLDDMVLIKDNHIAAAGSIAEAIEKCLTLLHTKKLNVKVEVETKNLDEVREVLNHRRGIHRIMLDNFPINETRQAVQLINHTVETEASGNVTLDNVKQIAETGVDFISIGALTHSPKALDISLEITR